MPGGEPRQHGRPQVDAANQDDRSARQPWRGERALTAADFTRSITLIEAARRVENDLAESLRAMAAEDGGEAGARRLRLAKEAERGARAAAKISEQLHEQARRWAEHGEVLMLRQALEHTASVLADLDRAESDLAGILTDLASHSSPDLAVRRRRLAAQASAAARHARNRAHALRQLAQGGAAGPQPDAAPVADPPDGPARLGPSRRQRLAAIDRRLTELRQARPEPAGGDTAPRAVGAARRHAAEAHASAAQVLASGAEAFGHAAEAHERAARLHEKAAASGAGDVREHQRQAALQRAAAAEDWRRAERAQSCVSEPGRTGSASVSDEPGAGSPAFAHCRA